MSQKSKYRRSRRKAKGNDVEDKSISEPFHRDLGNCYGKLVAY
jgi:hypothetical protein